MKISILTLFPEMFDNFKTSSIIKRAIDKSLVDIEIINIKLESDPKNEALLKQRNKIMEDLSMSAMEREIQIARENRETQKAISKEVYDDGKKTHHFSK